MSLPSSPRSASPAAEAPAPEPMQLDAPAAATSAAASDAGSLFGGDDDDAEAAVGRENGAGETEGERTEAVAEADDDLFGASDDEPEERLEPAEARSDDGSDDEVVNAARKRSDKRAATPSSASGSLRTPSPSPGAADDDLEHREDGSPMGGRRATPPPEKEALYTALQLPSLPVRRGAPHYLARLPNFLGFIERPYDPDTLNEEEEERIRGTDRIEDTATRKVVHGNSTGRWRWGKERDENGLRTRESNTRIVRWSDGTLSLQMGSEIYDITESVERAGPQASGAAADGISQAGMASQTAPAMGSGDAAAAQRARPAQPLQHLFVRMPDQQSYLAEGPIAGTLGLRPTDVQSETHKRLARAVKQQRGARVTQMQFDTNAEDPEAAKARIEKEQRLNSLKEARKKGKGRLARDDEDFSVSRRRHVPVGRTAALGSDEEDEEEEAVASGGEDGFVVDDASDEGEDAEGSAMDVDDEPDALDLMDGRIEAEAARRAKQGSKAAPAATTTVEDDLDAAAGGATEAEAGSRQRRRVVMDSDEE